LDFESSDGGVTKADNKRLHYVGVLRTWSRASEAVLWQNLKFYDKEKSFKDLFSAATCSPTLIVCCDIISGHAHKKT